MNSVHRSFGRLRERTQDGATVGLIVQNCTLTDNFLETLLQNMKAWRDGWADVIGFQEGTAESYITLYEPIPEPKGSERHDPVETQPEVLERVQRFAAAMKELRQQLLEEITLAETTVVNPLTDIKSSMESVKKALKKRDNKKLDYERYFKEVEHMKKKRSRTDRENATLGKAEVNLEAATMAYQDQDERLLEWVPPLLEKIQEAVSLLLQTLAEAQVQFFAQSYTVLLHYTQEVGYEESDMVVEQWEEAFEPAKRQLEESFSMIKQGKAVRMPMNQLTPSKSVIPLPGRFKKEPPTPTTSPPPSLHPQTPSIGRASSVTGDTTTERGQVSPFNSRPTLASRASTSNLSSRYARGESPPPPLPGNKPPPPASNEALRKPISKFLPSNRTVSVGSPTHLSVNPPQGEKPEWARLRPPSSSSKSMQSESHATESSITSFEDARSHFGKKPPSYNSAIRGQLNDAMLNPKAAALGPKQGLLPVGGQSVASTVSAATVIAAKKKPPPPPPKPKPKKFDNSVYVIALYTFEGQAQGDLSFKEGDRIRVTKKSDSMDDWWEGELNGKKGEFPANYTQEQ